MASIRFAVAGPTAACRESINCELDKFASGLKSSSFSGTRLNLPSLSEKFRSLELLVGHRGETRGAKGLEDGNLVPANHRMKVPSITLEEMRNARRNSYSSVKTSIMVVGLSVHTAPVSMREKLAIPEAEWPRAIGELCQFNHVEEAAVLSTCNRLEIYVVALSWNQGVQEVIQWMSKTSGIPAQDLREHLFILRDRNATQHLFTVSSGLDSLVIGEGQILSQVKQVCRVGELAPEFGRNLTGLFKQAITAGKRVRSETSIAAGAVSVSSAAVELAVMKLAGRPIQTAQVLIIGAGKMSKLLVKHLISKGCHRIVVVNRSEQRVLELQAEFGEAELVYQPMAEMMRCASDAEVIFTSTASDVPLFLKKDVETLASPSGGIRHFIDISVPRNVGDCVTEVESARVYNVDDLKEVVEANKEERKRKALEAQVIIDEELQSFEAWRASLQTVPTIKKLRAYAESIRNMELAKCFGKMGNDLTTKDRKAVDDLSRGIVNKLLHGPMQHLRSNGTDTRPVDQILENMHVLERMFDLN